MVRFPSAGNERYSKATLRGTRLIIVTLFERKLETSRIVSLDLFLPATLVGEDCVMGQKNVRAADRRLVSSRSAPGGCVVACSRRSDSRAREKNSRRKKKNEG